MTGSDRFIAHSITLEVIRSLRPVIARLRALDGDLVRQICRAENSVASNLLEGSKRAGKDRLHFFRIAAGSAAEVRAQIQAAEAWGHLDLDDLAPLMALFDRQAALLYRLVSPR